MKAAVLSALLAAAAPAAAFDCVREPRRALPYLVETALREGSRRMTDLSAGNILDAPASVRSLAYARGDLTRFFDVLTATGTPRARPRPLGILMGTRADSPDHRERWFFRASLDGRLQGAARVLDVLDVEGQAIGGQENFEVKGATDPDTVAAFEGEIQAHCAFAHARRRDELRHATSAASDEPNVEEAAALTMTDLADKAAREGEGAVIGGALAGYLGVEDPTTSRVLHFGEGADGLFHSLYVALNPGARPGQSKIQYVFMLTRRAEPGLEEKRFFRLSPAGALEQLTVVREKLDSKGLQVRGGRIVESVSVGEDDAKDWLGHEKEFYFRERYRKAAR